LVVTRVKTKGEANNNNNHSSTIMNFVRTLFLRQQQRRGVSREEDSATATAQQSNSHPSSEQAVVVGAQTKVPTKQKKKQRAQPQHQAPDIDVAAAVAGAATIPTTPTTRSLTSKEQVVAEFYRRINQHEVPGLFTEQADVIFIETPMTPQSFEEEMIKVFRSFPDFALRVVDGIVEQPDGTVLASSRPAAHIRVHRTRSGPIRTFLPRGLPLNLIERFVGTTFAKRKASYPRLSSHRWANRPVHPACTH
jgi:hypothetical protein